MFISNKEERMRSIKPTAAVEAETTTTNGQYLQSLMSGKNTSLSEKERT